MKTETGTFSFKYPENAEPEKAGTSENLPFKFAVCESDADVSKILAERKKTVLQLVNDWLKTNARSNAYQNAGLPYKPQTVSNEDIKERMVRDYMRLRIPEAMARQQVEALLAAMAAQESGEVSE
jgi:hypothetical protein